MSILTSSHTQLILLIILNALALAGDTIFWIRFVRKMKGFDWFVSQALYPISAVILLFPVLVGLYLSKKLSNKNFHFPKRFIAILALLGCGTNWGLTIVATLLPEQLVTVMMRLGTVTVILQSWLILGTRYKWTHLIGAVVVAVAAIIDVELGPGAATASISNHTHSSNHSNYSNHSNHSYDNNNNFLVGIILLLAMCCSPKGVLTEKWTKTFTVHPAFLRGMVALFTVGLGLLLSPLAFVRTSPSQSPVPMTWRGISIYLSSACGCFAGYSQSTYPDADCENAWVVYLAFIACNLTFDTTSIAIGKRGSAAIGAVGSSLSLVLTVVLTQIPWLTGLTEPAPLNAATFVSVGMIVVGLVLYATQKEMPRKIYATAVTGIRQDERKERRDSRLVRLLGDGDEG